MPTYILSVVPLCPMLFAISRIVFFKGYKGGGTSRGAGFSLTFYSLALGFVFDYS